MKRLLFGLLALACVAAPRAPAADSDQASSETAIHKMVAGYVEAFNKHDGEALPGYWFKNMATGQMQALEGMVEKKTQRVAWSVEGQSWPIVETGLSSLTQDNFPVLVHFANGETQQWLLVRLEEPKT